MSHALRDLAFRLENRPGALAAAGEALGAAGVSLEGGGAFTVDGIDGVRRGIAHFLIAAGSAAPAREALAAAGVAVIGDREVLVQRLDQERPGQLGAICRRMADAGVNIETLDSDHQNQLILVVDDPARGRAVSEAWMRERGSAAS